MTLTKFLLYKALFYIKTEEIQFFLLAVKKKSHLNEHVLVHSVLLNSPIKAEIRAVGSQSDLRILL